MDRVLYLMPKEEEKAEKGVDKEDQRIPEPRTAGGASQTTVRVSFSALALNQCRNDLICLRLSFQVRFLYFALLALLML